jgi:hypothetical protein
MQIFPTLNCNMQIFLMQSLFVTETFCCKDVLLQETFCYGDVLLRRRSVTETFCYWDVLLQRRFVTGDVLLRRRSVTETFCYGDVLLRRRFVWRRFVEETFCAKTFCMCATKCTVNDLVKHWSTYYSRPYSLSGYQMRKTMGGIPWSLGWVLISWNHYQSEIAGMSSCPGII